MQLSVQLYQVITTVWRIQ